MQPALLCALVVVFAVVATVLVRAVLFVPKKQPEISPEPIFVDKNKAASDLSEMIKCTATAL